MIPRRRIDVGWADLHDLLHSIGDSATTAQAAVRAFESASSRLLNGRPARATASGRDALDLILEGLGIGAGDELVIPAYTLGELVARLQARGLRPVAADVDVDSFCVTPESVAQAISPRTRAIVVLHTFGAPCDIEGIAKVAAAHELPLIEDCAHAFGASIGGMPAGCFGVGALFSLEVAKPVATFGGGLLATANDDLLALAGRRLDGRQRSIWPVFRKTLMKCGEEFAVRSPAYGLAARLMFRDSRTGGFERLYRDLHDRVRPVNVAFSGFQARRGLRRLAMLSRRNQELNQLWNHLAANLPSGFTAQSRERHGCPAAYNFVARFQGNIDRMRQRAQRLGLDLAIRSEVLDDVAPMLGQTNCSGSARVFSEAVAIPLHKGVDDVRLRRIAQILATAGRA